MNATGRIVHLNVPAVDLARAQRFYGAVFGWVFTPNTDTYVLFSDRGGIGGGLTTAAEPSDDGVVFFIDVVDIPGALRAVVREGGETVLEKTPVGGPGYYAIFRDTEGNRVGLYSET